MSRDDVLDVLILDKVSSCGCLSQCGAECKCGKGWWATFIFPAPEDKIDGVRSSIDQAIDIFSTKKKEKKEYPDGKVEVKVFLGINKDEAEAELKEYDRIISERIKLIKKPFLSFEPRNDKDFILYNNEYLLANLISDDKTFSLDKKKLRLVRRETEDFLKGKYGENYTGTNFLLRIIRARAQEIAKDPHSMD